MHKLRIFPIFTQLHLIYYANKLRRYYANKLRNHYAIITQINYADFTQINYAIITQSLRMLRSHYANKLRRFYANKLRNSLRRLRNSITQIRLRNSPKCHYADYANTDFHYAKIQFITQWATCWCSQLPGLRTKPPSHMTVTRPQTHPRGRHSNW